VVIYLEQARCRLFAYGQVDATASQTPLSLAPFKSRLVLPSWYWLTQVVPERVLNSSRDIIITNYCCNHLTASFPGQPGIRKPVPER